MTPLIDYFHFVGELNLPHLGTGPRDQLTLIINQRQEELLMALLGYPLFKAFDAGLLEDEPEQRWKDLRDGAEFTDRNGYPRKWMGLREKADGPSRRSLIANYVYYWFLRDKATRSTGIGETTDKGSDSEPASPAVKQCRAWNQMVLWIEELILFLQASTDTYPEWAAVNLCELRERFRPINAFNL